MRLDYKEDSTQSSKADINVSRNECETLLIESVVLHMRLAYDYICEGEYRYIIWNIYC